MSMTWTIKALCSYDAALCFHVDMLTPNNFVLLTTLGGDDESQLKKRPAGVSLSLTHTYTANTHALTHSLTLPSVMNKTLLAEKHTETARNGKCLVEVWWNLK